MYCLRVSALFAHIEQCILSKLTRRLGDRSALATLKVGPRRIVITIMVSGIIIGRVLEASDARGFVQAEWGVIGIRATMATEKSSCWKT
jgi:hypothetical protein